MHKRGWERKTKGPEGKCRRGVGMRESGGDQVQKVEFR